MQQLREQGSESMAEKKMQNRVLSKCIPSMQVNTDGSSIPSLLEGTSAGWTEYTGFQSAILYVWEGYIDLQGMTVAQDLSCAVHSVDVQEGAPVLITCPSAVVWDIVTDVPINWSEALLNNDDVWLTMPGFLGSEHNLENVVQGSSRTFSPGSSATEGPIQVQGSRWGSNRATASDRLYISRVLAVTPAAGLTPAVVLPPTVFVMPVIFFEEKDLEHMERLRRSYILQQ